MIDNVINAGDKVGFIAAVAMEDVINDHSPDLMSKLNTNQNVMFLGKEYTTEEFNKLMFVWHGSVEIAIDNYKEMKNSEIYINPKMRNSSVDLTTDYFNTKDSPN